ncbi:carboxymuconolactone decarboxylase family protein [Streptomyces sp. 16-176A]|uniref:carboxymuconolactone decarboxylase family protein n=1 Tax=Streptomyces sp. 16-176A TaxID=2530458 RepID=UPI00345D2383
MRLSPRELILLALVADVCEQPLGLPFQLHVRATLERLAEIEREHGLPGPTGTGHHVNADGTGSPIPAPMRAEVRAHVGRALATGATPDEVRAAVRATAPYGMTRAWRALNVLDTLLAETADRP